MLRRCPSVRHFVLCSCPSDQLATGARKLRCAHSHSGANYNNEMPPLPPHHYQLRPPPPGAGGGHAPPAPPGSGYKAGFTSSSADLVDFEGVPSFEFGSAQDETLDLWIGRLNSDEYFDVVEANGFGHTKIYYGDHYSHSTGDMGHIQPVVLNGLHERANTRHVQVADMDQDGHNDVVVHNVAQRGNCAVRCREEGRFGFAKFTLRTTASSEHDGCYCSTKISEMHTPAPPPSPPRPPPSPDPPPPSPPSPAPESPPPSPPLPLVRRRARTSAARARLTAPLLCAPGTSRWVLHPALGFHRRVQQFRTPARQPAA